MLTTGYSEAAQCRESLDGMRLLQKPYRIEEIEAALRAVWSSRSGFASGEARNVRSQTEPMRDHAGASPPQLFDADIRFDETTAVTPPGPEHARAGVPDTYPLGL